jgi:nucleoside-diphosphate-sugar epimerase
VRGPCRKNSIIKKKIFKNTKKKGKIHKKRMYREFLLLLISFSLWIPSINSERTLVIGSSGRVGRSVVAKLINAGVKTRVLHRSDNFTCLPSLTNSPLLEICKGDVLDSNSLDKAMVGITNVIAVHGAKPPRLSKITDIFTPLNMLEENHPYKVNYIGTLNILQSMKKNNVKKLIRLTGALIGRPVILNPFIALFNLLLSMTIKWHEQSEISIRNSGLDYTVVRPTGIRDEPTAEESNRKLLLIQGDSNIKLKLPGLQINISHNFQL